jgi:Cft2 family RNA processing exonuclease
MFHFDRGLKLTKADLAVDFRRRQPRGFVSHAHIDHMARHVYALCTPETSRLYQHRLGPRDVLELPYRKTVEWGGLRLTTYPAGHCLGSAMLLAEDPDGRPGKRSLLYTGDFKLGESATAAQAELPHAEILVMESTYGEPFYRRRPRAEAIAELVAVVHEALDSGRTPVILAYALGKSQEVTRILTRAGIPVFQHPDAFAVSQVYESLGVHLGDCQKYPGRWQPGHAVIAPPRFHRSAPLARLGKPTYIGVTGWAQDPDTRRRWGVDHAIPLSDHADYDELLECVARVQPQRVYCTHGPTSFVDRLRRLGHEAYVLGAGERQEMLFAC